MFTNLQKAVTRRSWFGSGERKLRQRLRQVERARRLRCEALENRLLLSVSYPTFPDSDGLNLVGRADTVLDDLSRSVLRLTPAAQGNPGGAWFTQQQFVSVDFDTTFTFRLHEGSDGGDGTDGSDGFAFMIQNFSVSALGGGGGGLGYSGIPNSLAVEFDTWQNSEFNDPSKSHISVHTRGTDPNDVHENYSLGAYDTYNQAGFILDNARDHTVNISYASATQILRLSLDNLGVVLTASVDLAETLELNAGRAWVGFVGTTGGGWQNHDIVSWQFNSATDTTPVVAIANAQLVEGDAGTTQSTDFPVTVTRPDTSGPLTVQIDYATADGTATSDSGDYTPATGTLTFNLADGQAEATQIVQVTVNGDDLEEAHETYSVHLSNPLGAVIIDGRGEGTILNDDTALFIDDITVTEGDAAPRFIDAFILGGIGILDDPNAMTFGPNGDLYVAGQTTDNVVRYDAVTGQMIGQFVSAGSGGLDNPRALTFGSDGNLYVASAATDSVLRYQGPSGADPGQFIDIFVAAGSGGLDQPYRAVFGPDGNLYVCSQPTDNILRYQGPSGANPGQFIDAFVTAASGGLDAPTGLDFGPDGNLYVAGAAVDSVLRYQGPSGAIPGRFMDVFVGAGSGGLDDPHDLAFDSDGRIYVSSAATDEVLRYQGPAGANPGQYIDDYVGTSGGGLDSPREVTFGADGNLYVVSRGTDEVLRYGPASQLVFTATLSYASALPVTADFATEAGTATAGVDYNDMYEGEANKQTLTFAPGETSKTIVVPTFDDFIPENSEACVVNLSNETGATLADDQGLATILDNDVYAVVIDRHLFYNHSAWDGQNSAANALDDGAIASDKAVLLPGQTATFVNYTSYDKGINGLMIDVQDLPGMPTVDDFLFRIGNDGEPYGKDANNPADDWPCAPDPMTITVRVGAGVAGADRVTLTWKNGQIRNRWLQVTVLSSEATGLAENDVFYVGNAVGESGNSTTDALVNATDEIGARNNSRGPFNPAPRDDRYDYNRDQLVNATDQIIARNNRTSPFTALKLIKPPLESGGGDGEGEGEGEAGVGRPELGSDSSYQGSLQLTFPASVLGAAAVFEVRVLPVAWPVVDGFPSAGRGSSAQLGSTTIRSFQSPGSPQRDVARAWSPDAQGPQLQRESLAPLDRHTLVARRARWVTESKEADFQDAFDVALAELVAEWDQF